MVAIPRHASTVIVLKRYGPSNRFHVFLLKRSEKSAFMGSNFVYPGGTVDRQDSEPGILSYCKGIPSEEAQRELIPFMIAGIRELFEEAGMLLAYDKDGRPFAIQEPATRDRFNRYRKALHKKEITLAGIAENEGLFLALDQLYHYAHWITPEARPLRFNTHFFVARYPEGQKASADETETSDGMWMSPTDALKANSADALVLSPPTLKTLEDLSRFTGIDEVVAFSVKAVKPTILSLLLEIAGQPFLVFPWDPDYERLKSGEPPLSPGVGRPSGLSDNSTRILTANGRNVPFIKT